MSQGLYKKCSSVSSETIEYNQVLQYSAETLIPIDTENVNASQQLTMRKGLSIMNFGNFNLSQSPFSAAGCIL